MESHPVKLLRGPYLLEGAIDECTLSYDADYDPDLVKLALRLETPEVEAHPEATTLGIYMTVAAADKLRKDLAELLAGLDYMRSQSNSAPRGMQTLVQQIPRSGRRRK